MANKQMDPDLVPQKRAVTMRSGSMAGRSTTSVAMPTPARMKAGKGISNGVKPGKQKVC